MGLVRRHWEFWVIAACTLLIHLIAWRGYGWFRDEFYYVVCARHLAWGYVDHPPLSIAILRLVVGLFGESLQAMRAVAGIGHAVTVVLAGLITRELGGGRGARVVAMVAAAAAPQAMSLTFFYSMNAIDLVMWPAITLALLVALRTGQMRSWAWVGLWVGLGLLNKISVVWFGGGLAVALLLTPFRRELVRPGVWLAAVIAAVLFAPHVVWQMQHGWPTLEFMRNAAGDKMAARSALTFARAVMNDEGIVVALLGLAGVGCAFLRGMDPRARVLAWIWLAVFALLVLNGTSRTGYLTPAWTLSFVLGGLAVERAAASRWRRAVATVTVVVIVFGCVALPMALPILPTESFMAYAAALGRRPSSEEKKEVGRLPSFFADMNGWTSIVASVEAAWRQLPVDEQPRAVFFGTNYGEAGAVDVLGRVGLTSVGAHNNYFLWGPPSDDVDAVVVMSQNPARWSDFFEHVQLAGRTDCGDCMPYENKRDIYVAWGRRLPWAVVWPALKHFD